MQGNLTSLMIAIYSGSSEVVKTEIVDILLRSGADVNITDRVSLYIQLDCIHKLSLLLLYRIMTQD